MKLLRFKLMILLHAICFAYFAVSSVAFSEDVFLKSMDFDPRLVISFQGTITKVSDIPDPQKNDYDNCLYSVEISVCGISDKTEKANQIILAIPIIKNNVLIGSNVLKEKQNIRGKAVKYETLSENIRQIQMSDTIENFEAPVYYLLCFEEEKKLQKTIQENSSMKVVNLPKALTPSQPDFRAADLRKQRIQNELAAIDQILAKHGSSFSLWRKEFRKIQNIVFDLAKEDKKSWINGSFFANPSLFYLNNEKRNAFIQALLPYKEYLQKNNIDLILCRVPSKGDLSSAVFLSTSEYTDNPYWLELYRDCLKNDIEIVDPLPEMWKRYNEFPLCYFYHIPEEGHPFTGGSFIIADVLSNVLKRYTEQSDADSFVLSESAYVSPGRRNRAYYPTGNSKYDPTKLMSFPVVLSKKTNAVPSLESNTESPFLFCSNSFGAYPSRMAGGSIPHYTIYRTGIIPAWFYQDGIGMSMLRHCVTKPQILQNRKAVILIMHPNMWWEPISAFPVSIKLNITQMVLEKAILPADVQKSISMKEHSDEAIGILSADNLSLSLNHYQEKSDFFFSIPSSEKDKHLPHIIRVNFQAHGYINYENTEKVSGQMSIEVSKPSYLDLFYPADCRKYEFNLRNPGNKPLIIKSIEIYQCK